jgi:hypothetical protein
MLQVSKFVSDGVLAVCASCIYDVREIQMLAREMSMKVTQWLILLSATSCSSTVRACTHYRPYTTTLTHDHIRYERHYCLQLSCACQRVQHC